MIINTKEIIKQLKFNDSIDGNFKNFIKFVEETTGVKLKLYQKVYMRLTLRPQRRHYVLISEDIKDKQRTIEFKNGSKLTIIPECGEIVRSKRGEEQLKRIQNKGGDE